VAVAVGAAAFVIVDVPVHMDTAVVVAADADEAAST
jgi:hypothetical protein